MRYVKNEPFVTVRGGPFAIAGVMGDPERKTEQATVGEVLYWLLSSYSPQHGRALALPELRNLNRVLDKLEAGPGETSDFFAFEGSEYDVLKRVALQEAILLSPRNAPVIEDLLEAAPKEL